MITDLMSVDDLHDRYKSDEEMDAPPDGAEKRRYGMRDVETLISVDCSKNRCFVVVAKLLDFQSVRVMDCKKFCGNLVSFCFTGDKCEQFSGVNLTKTPETDKQELTQEGCDCEQAWSIPSGAVHIDVARELEMKLNLERARKTKVFSLTASECQRVLSRLDENSDDIVTQGLIIKIMDYVRQKAVEK